VLLIQALDFVRYRKKTEYQERVERKLDELLESVIGLFMF